MNTPRKPANSPASLTLVKSVELSQATRLDSIRGILGDLPTMQRNKVVAETEEFLKAQQTAARSFLAMGQHLLYVRDVLEPLEKWKAYINLLPNLSQATAYRMIWAFENANRALPPATREVAILEGYKLISSRKDEMFAPGYEEAVKVVTKEHGPAPERDAGKARAWLQAVMQTKRNLSKKPAGSRDPATTAVVETEAIERRIVNQVLGLAAKLTPEAKREFGLRLAGMILSGTGAPTYKVKPVLIPEAYTGGGSSRVAAA